MVGVKPPQPTDRSLGAPNDANGDTGVSRNQQVLPPRDSAAETRLNLGSVVSTLRKVINTLANYNLDTACLTDLGTLVTHMDAGGLSSPASIVPAPVLPLSGSITSAADKVATTRKVSGQPTGGRYGDINCHGPPNQRPSASDYAVDLDTAGGLSIYDEDSSSFPGTSSGKQTAATSCRCSKQLEPDLVYRVPEADHGGKQTQQTVQNHNYMMTSSKPGNPWIVNDTVAHFEINDAGDGQKYNGTKQKKPKKATIAEKRAAMIKEAKGKGQTNTIKYHPAVKGPFSRVPETSEEVLRALKDFKRDIVKNRKIAMVSVDYIPGNSSRPRNKAVNNTRVHCIELDDDATISMTEFRLERLYVVEPVHRANFLAMNPELIPYSAKCEQKWSTAKAIALRDTKHRVSQDYLELFLLTFVPPDVKLFAMFFKVPEGGDCDRRLSISSDSWGPYVAFSQQPRRQLVLVVDFRHSYNHGVTPFSLGAHKEAVMAYRKQLMCPLQPPFVLPITVIPFNRTKLSLKPGRYGSPHTARMTIVNKPLLTFHHALSTDKVSIVLVTGRQRFDSLEMISEMYRWSGLRDRTLPPDISALEQGADIVFRDCMTGRSIDDYRLPLITKSTNVFIW